MTGVGARPPGWLLAAALAAAGAQASAQAPFTRQVIDAGFHGDCKAIADFDGDGLIDVAVGGAGGLKWYRYPAWTPTTIALPAVEFTTDMQAGDVDGDGDPDLIVPDQNAGPNILWFENPRPGGDPAVAPWPRHAIGAFGWSHDLEVGDIDRDGRLDVVTRQGATALWLQTSPDLWTRVDLPAAVPGGEGVAIGDLDGDGDPDLALNGYWLEAPPNPGVGSAWLKHDIVAGWPDLCGVRITDLDADGRADVVLAASESAGRLAWFQGPPDPRTATAWPEFPIDPSVDYVHTFQVADIDRNGRLDVAFAEMAQSSRKRVGVFYNQGAGMWSLDVLSVDGSHNLRAGDLGGDGDIDLVGANWQGPPVEWWENGLPPCQPGLDRWSYVEVDSTRAKWGDWDTPDWAKYFGLAMGDLTGDGFGDIVSGRYFYRNPRGGMAGPWTRVDLGRNCDAHSILDVDGDAYGDVMASAGDTVLWLEATDALGSAWSAIAIDTAFPKPGHGNPQGYAVADIVPGGRRELLLADDAGGSIWCYQIPAAPELGAWPRTAIASAANGEGIGVGDIDRDGLDDIAVAHEPPGWTPSDPRWIKWAKNPGDGSGNWSTTLVGVFDGPYPDRVAVGDLNGDGRRDIVVSEEDSGATASARTSWFEAPVDPVTGTWTRHALVQQYTTNSLDLADLDVDGDLDIVTGEHRGDETVAVWENDGVGGFTERVVDSGKESHLGARVADLDGDGDLEIVSIAWDDHAFLHLWRNDNGCGVVDPPNRAPSVFAGPDQAVVLPARVAALAGSVSDDGLPKPVSLTTLWTLASGPGSATFADPSAASTSVVLERAGDYVLRLTAADGALSAFDQVTVRVLPFASELLLHWTLDDGNGATATCSTPWSNHGTVSGASWTAGVLGGGLDFDGSASHVERPSAALRGPFPATAAQGDAFTVSAWIRLDRVDQRNPIAGKQGNEQRGFLLMTEDSNRVTLEVFRDAVSGTSVGGATALAVGRNYHVAATYEFRGDGASAVRIYLDGALDGSLDTAVGPLAANGTAFEAGRYWWSSAYSVYLDGLIDDVRVHGRALGGCEVGRLANPAFDTDHDSLPDAWETARLGGIGQAALDDGDLDQLTNLDEYVAGTDPAGSASRVVLWLVKGAGGAVVGHFDTEVAAGAGFECETRVYDLTLASDAAFGPWQPTPPCVGVAATGAREACAIAPAGALDFLRLAPRLTR